jgi:hypothetical protein
MKCGKIDMFLSIAFTRKTRLADVYYLVLRKCRKERKKEGYEERKIRYTERKRSVVNKNGKEERTNEAEKRKL